jgi:signal peptidase I
VKGPAESEVEASQKPIRRFPKVPRIIVVLVSLAILFLAVRQFVAQPFGIPTGAMEPTLMGSPDRKTIGDRIIVSKLAYWFHGPRRGDIVVFKTVDISKVDLFPRVPPDQIHVKRVVGIPGDTVSIRPPFVQINGKELVDPPIFAKIASGSNGFSGYAAIGHLSEGRQVTLGPDEYFVLGDNSRNSLDSRFFGPIKRKRIIGRAAWIYAPSERRGRLE